MKTVCKKLLSLMLVAILLVSAVPFQAFATEGETTAATTETTAATVETTAATVETTAATVETTAPAETVAEPTETTAAAPVEGTVSQPAVQSVGDSVKVVFSLDAYNQANILTVDNVKIGYLIGMVPDALQVLQSYAQYAGNYTGKQFGYWKVRGGSAFDPYTTNVTDSIATAGQTLYIDAVVTDQPLTITLDPNGGVVSTLTHQVKLGQTYNAVSSLPTPSLIHHTFQYWYKLVNGKEVPVNGDTKVTDISALTAKWAVNKYTVTFQKFDIASNSWVTVKTPSVSALSIVDTTNGFPTDTEIANNFALSGYTIVGWEIEDTDVAFTAGATQITKSIIVRPRYQRTVTLMANNPNDYTSNTTKTITVEIGEPIPALPNPGARDGYTFVDWVAEDQTSQVSSKENLSNASAHRQYYPNLGTTFYARWTPSTVVYLYIHTNGNTQTATKIVPYYEAPTSGAFNMNLINMYSIFPNYGDFDDTNDAVYGWYDATQWKNFCANTAANAATTYYDIAQNGYIEFHIMLINGGGTSSSTTNNYNTNSSTADTSNPTTGDYIFMAVTVLAVSGAALALLFLMKKRKSSK